MRITKLALLAAVVLGACGNSSGNSPSDAPNVVIPDAPEFAPILTGLQASPTQVPAGVPTPVTFTWAYLVEPTFPEPTCTLDNGVGPVMRGVPVMITISQFTLYTLTCSNRAGQATRQVIVSVPPVAPQLATFTVSPSSVTAGVATPVTFTWTYSNTPNPPPTCSVDGGTTTITSGTPVPLTLTQARTFRLRCTNSQGTVYSGSAPLDVTVAANECGTAYAQCDPHANCVDTQDSYTCTCMNGYTASGDTCLFNTSTSTDCDANCPLIGASCVPKGGFVGSGQVGDCKRARFTFVTSATYTGAAINGLGGADTICKNAAAAYNTTPYLSANGGLPGTYVAWLSSATDDAYCRTQPDSLAPFHLTGKKSGNCGLGALPVAAGPWVRVGDWKQWSPTIDKLLAPNHVTYYPANTSELGTEITSTSERVWTGTDDTGQYVANGTCLGSTVGSDWTATTNLGTYGEVQGGGQSWTQSSATNISCANAYHLRCVEVASGAPATLPPRHPVAKKAFITSVTGNGYLSMWPDAYGQTGNAAADAICQARARYAGYANASKFMAWLAPYTGSVSAKFLANTAPYARPDGVILGNNETDMLDNKLAAAWYETETNQYLAGNADSGSVATNIYPSSTTGSYNGSYTSACYNWTSNYSGYYWYYGRYDLLDSRAYGSFSSTSCDQTALRFLCAEDQ